METHRKGRLQGAVKLIPTLRPFQAEVKAGIHQHWNQGSRNVTAVLPTGAGKTVIASDMIHDHHGASIAIAHRQELVTQISLSLGSFGVKHRLIAPDKVIKSIINEQRAELGAVFYDPQASAAVAGVDTLVSRADSLKQWCSQITLWFTDECHHVSSNGNKPNKWMTATQMFPNARGLGVTATPQRADGKGLGAHADGVFNSMVIGPSMRELIDDGYLTDYQIVCPPSDFNVEEIKVTATGDFSQRDMIKESRKSHIVGDVVENYIKWAAGKRGIVFATDVETAHHMAQQFRDAGIRAEAVSAKTPDATRNDYVRRFRHGLLDVLVNVDLFGEGFDLPAVEVVSMARPTQSLAVYMQQFGRALRILDGKINALIIDHVGNVVRHSLPDIPRLWTLDRRAKQVRSTIDEEVLKLTTCLVCYQPYERIMVACPHCGSIPEPQGRRAPEQVDGDLELLDVDILVKMREAALSIEQAPEIVGARVGYATGNPIAGKGAENRHREKQEAQQHLRNSIATWAGRGRASGRSDRELYRLFFHMFGVDVLTAQSLPRAEADKLREIIG